MCYEKEDTNLKRARRGIWTNLAGGNGKGEIISIL